MGPVLVDGEPVDPAGAAVSVFDIGFQRGYGCFETLRSYGGVPFRMSQHLDRLEHSANLLRMPLPDRDDLERWVTKVATAGDVAVKLYVTGGRDAADPGVKSTTVVFAEELPDLSAPARLLPVRAPWHPGGRWSELTGAKTLSYAPNMAARLTATAAGYDDALLLGADEHVLEGPTYSIAWMSGVALHHPHPDLGVLASVTAGAVLDIAPKVGLEPHPGRFRLADVLAADEVIVMSTLSEVRPVGAIGDAAKQPGPLTAALAGALAQLVARETATP